MAIADLQPDRYLVFEADQVLTNNHLNQLFYYLDQQNRWTRNKLIGIGIACGLEIVLKPGIIEVTKGCGVTSQGYLILHGPKQYTYYLPYDAVARPEHLPFEYDSSPGLPFFKEYCDKAGPVFQLLDDEGYNDLEAAKKPQAKTISSATVAKLLDDYVVVLFLEADEIDLKNCDAFDCNNEGERMLLQVRPLLVRKHDLPEAIAKTESTKLKKRNIPVAAITATKLTAPEVALRRFNVPHTLLRSTDDIINAFAKITDDATLDSIDAAYQFCYNKYKSIVKAGSNPFGGLADALIKQRKAILAKQPWLIQYFYDFIDDLVKAYLEFRAKMNTLQSACCPDENRFPLHLVLGEAIEATSSLEKNAYRTYFIYSPLFARQEAELGEIEMLFRRMVLLTEEFNLVEHQAQQAAALNQLRTNRQGDEATIKITPSRYELAWLSQRAIPYYYEVNEKGNELYKHWNFYKTTHGNAAFNLGYHSYQYSGADVVLQPLLYDIEHFDFFRIEGHIGLPYQSVLNYLLKQRLNYNLPFDVVAISAERLPRTDTAELPECNIEDLDTDYKLIISEFACKVVTPFCYLAGLPVVSFAKNTKFSTETSNLAGATASAMADATGKDDKEDEETNEKVYSFFKQTSIESKSSQYVYYMKPAYAKGDFMKAHCTPKDGTIGAAYLTMLKDKGSFSNPYPADAKNNVLAVYYYLIYEYIDAVETVMQYLMTATIATLDVAAFKKAYIHFVKITAALAAQTGVWLDALTVNIKERPYYYTVDVWVDLLIESLTLATGSCIDERLQTLKDEYNRRLQQYALQRSFYYYYSKHPGLEHKAGVPKGGTFVLVYHTGQRQVQTSATVDTMDTVFSMQSAATAKTDTATLNNTKADTTSGTIQYQSYNATYLNAFKSFVDECTDASPDKKNFVLTLIDNLQATQEATTRFEIPDGAVIADFYVPYLCCSDCPPVAYILPGEKDPQPETAEFSIQAKEYVFDDAHNYAFTAKPLVTDAGREQDPFSSSGVLNPGNLNLLTDESNTLYLHPALPDIERTLQTTVSYKGISLPIIIIKPDAAFTYSITTDASGAKMLQIAATDGGADTYEWTVNGRDVKINSQAVPTPVNITQLKNDLQAKTLEIALTVSYTRNEVTSTSTKTILLEICIDFEPPLKVNTVYGSPVKQPPGTAIIVTDDGVILKLVEFHRTANSTFFGLANILKFHPAYKDSQYLNINDACVEFDYSKSGFFPTEVRVDLADDAIIQNISVNESLLNIGRITEAPTTMDGVSVTTITYPNEGHKMTLLLKGNISKFKVGGSPTLPVVNVCATRYVI